jgi:hypothetical protein
MTAIKPKLASIVNNISNKIDAAAAKSVGKDKTKLDFQELSSSFKPGTQERKLVELMYNVAADRTGEANVDRLKSLLTDAGAAQVQKAAGIDGNKGDLSAKELLTLDKPNTKIAFTLGRIVVTP